MPHSRFAIALLIIGTALSASYFIITDPLQLGKQTDSEEKLKGSFGKELAHGAELLKKNVFSIFNPDTLASDDANGATASSENLTDYLSKIIAGQIQDKNKDGPTQKEDGTVAILVPGEDNIINIFDTLPEAQPIPAEPAYHPKVAAAKLMISKDTSKTSQEKYAEEYLAIIGRFAGDLPKTEDAILRDIAEKKDPASALQFANLLGVMADSYSQMQIPENWLSFHRGVLSHYYSAEDIWKNIANFQKDPVQALVSLKELPLLSQSSAGLKILLDEQLKKNLISLN